jgi:pimeloyl-ACP methyl ester carboxylesterase
MSYLKIRDVEHYYEWIRADHSTHSPKPVMVFMHGWGGSARYWESTAHALKDQFDCLLYDLRGFGRSSLPETTPPFTLDLYELETYAEDLHELLQQLGLERVYLNAHSTGSSIAAFFLNLYPKQVEQAILTCSGIFEYQPWAFKQFHRFGTYVVKLRPRWLYGLPGMERVFMSRFLHRQIPGLLQKAFLEDFLMASYDAALGTLLTAVSEKAARVMPGEFARFQVPTLLISGQYDKIIPVPLGEAAAAQSSLVEQVVIPKTAHFPMLEDAPRYLQVVQEFLNASEPTYSC